MREEELIFVGMVSVDENYDVFIGPPALVGRIL